MMADVHCGKDQQLDLPSFYTRRGFKQYFRAQIVRMFYPKCKPEVIATINERIKNYEKVLGSISTTCRCGALKLTVNSAPRIVTVCHCGVCRYETQRGLSEDDKAKAKAPAFGAFRRDDIRMYKNLLDKGTESSDGRGAGIFWGAHSNRHLQFANFMA